MSEHSESRASRRSGYGEGFDSGDKASRYDTAKDPNINPFSIPKDDLIFEFKD